jgi:hypothetical protein
VTGSASSHEVKDADWAEGYAADAIDFAVREGGHGGGGHRFALVGELFVRLVAEDIAEVRDRGVEFGDHLHGEGTERETGDDGRRLVASKPVKKSGDDGQRAAHRRGISRVAGPDCQGEVIEQASTSPSPRCAQYA